MTENFLSFATIIVSLVLSAGALILSFRNYRNVRNLNHLKDSFFTGKNGTDLEQILFTISENLQDLDTKQQLTQTNLEILKENFRFAIQKVGLVKFNPFSDSGGSFSFSLALLDQENSGVVITNMHGRENNRIYSKKIIQGNSEIQLTNEELQALEIANQEKITEKTNSRKTKAKNLLNH